MSKHSHDSLLTRFFGLYKVTLPSPSSSPSRQFLRRLLLLPPSERRHYYVLVMNCVYPFEVSQFITQRVDVKGSTVGRVTSEDERRRDAQAVLKDGDLLRRSSPLVVGIKRKAALLAQVRKDVNFLVACGVMDYSLLVGVVSLTDGYYDDDDDTGEERGMERKEGWKHALLLPLRALFSPAAYLSTSLASVVGRTVPTLLSTHHLPYHGAKYPLLPERKEPGGGGGFTISVLLTFCSLGASEKWSNGKPRACWGTIARGLVAFRRGSMKGDF